MQGVRIFFLAIGASIFYGIVHDQITIRICLEYFTVYHPPVFGSLRDPTLLAAGWGVIATWWVGAIMGVPLALAARVGVMPKRSAGSMVGPIGVLLGCMAGCAAAAGVAAYFYGSTHFDRDPGLIGMPQGIWIPFRVDLWMHLASYGSGFVGGCFLIIWTLIIRHQTHVARLLAERAAERG